MKSIIKIFTLALVAIIMLSLNTVASVTVSSFIEDAEVSNLYIHHNCTTLKYDKAISVNFIFEEESYVNDIPFNTDSITNDYNYSNAITENFEMEEESYIDDIPFNTKE